MYRLKPSCAALSLFLCFSLNNCAVLSRLPPSSTPSSARDTDYPSHVAVDDESSLSLDATISHKPRRRYPSKDQKGYRGNLMDFLDDEIAEDAALQVITSVSRGGSRILFDPSGADGSMIPLMLNAMNETSGPVREVIMFDDLWGQIPILTSVYWKDILKNFESWSTAIQATNTNTTIPQLPVGLPRVLPALFRRETFTVLKEVITLCARVPAWNDLFNTKRTDLDSTWKAWDNAARRLNKPNLWNATTRPAWEDEASRLEREVLGKKADADAHLKAQQTWGVASIDIIITELDRLVRILDDRVANITAQCIWYEDAIKATGTPLDKEGEVGFWLRRGIDKARGRADWMRPQPREAVTKAKEAMMRLKALQEPWLVEENAYLRSTVLSIERTQGFMEDARELAREMRARPATTESVGLPVSTMEIGWDVVAKETQSFAWGRDRLPGT